MRIFAKAFLFGLIYSACCYGQQDAPNTCLDRTFIVNVTDRALHRVAGLSASAFMVTVDGQKAELISVTLYSATPRLIILIDTSGSMRNTPGKTDYVNASFISAMSILKMLPKSAQVSVMTFADKAEVLTEFGEDGNATASKLREKLLNNKKSSRTALLEAILQASEKFGITQSGDSILMVTDGEEIPVKYDPQKIARLLAVRRIRFFVQLFPVDSRGTPEELQALASTPYVAMTSGGKVSNTPFENLSPPDETALAKISTELLAHARTGYLVTIHLEKPLDKWKKWKLEIKGPNGKVERNYHVEFPTELAPCEPASRP